jgi:cellobiose dehydrogenase (acceptor)
VGDGEFSTVSLGGFTFGMVLPGNAATVDSYEYIGLIVCFLLGLETNWKLLKLS